VGRQNLGHAHAPTEKDRASFIDFTIKPLEQSGRLHLVDEGHAFAPGVTAWITHGHTPGQCLVKVGHGKDTVIFMGDTIPTSSHIPIPYVMAYDNEPLVTMREKRAILEPAAAEEWTLVFAHDPKVAACRVRRDGERFARAENVEL
jgi:glyoxylase-like metal-dependent hydrolase (beta-lactamase superfamily II)